MRSTKMLRRLAIEVTGWALVVVGIAALVLPGPGLLCLFAGLAILSQQYEWAERRLRPVEVMALKSAAEGVKTWPRILASCAGAVAIGVVGVIWGIGLDAPGWWPIDDAWWLPGGWATATTLIASSLLALGMIVYSYRRFHDVENVEEIIAKVARGEG